MPRFYGFDGSTGMDLRPVGQLEAEDAARRERERRRHPMPVTTRIRLVSQPPEGLLPLSLFDRVGLADRKSLYPRSMETVPPDLAGLYVDYMVRRMGLASRRLVPVDEGQYEVSDEGAGLVRRSGQSGRLVGFDSSDRGVFQGLAHAHPLFHRLQ